MGITYGKLIENAYKIQVSDSAKRAVSLDRIRQAVRNDFLNTGGVLYEPWEEIPDTYVRGFSQRVERVIRGFLQ